MQSVVIFVPKYIRKLVQDCCDLFDIKPFDCCLVFCLFWGLTLVSHYLPKPLGRDKGFFVSNPRDSESDLNKKAGLHNYLILC